MTSSRAQTPARGQGGGGQGSNSMLLELVDRILDKGIVIDAWARVSVLSIELLTIEARVVVASVDTYLRYAEAIGNTALASMPHPQQAQHPLTAQGGGQPQQQGQLAGQQLQGLPAPQQQNLMPQRQGQQQQMPPQPAVQPQQPQQPPQQAQQMPPQQMPPPQQQPQPSPQPGH